MMNFLVTALVYSTAIAVPLTSPHPSGSLSTVYQFPNRTWLESIALRKNDNLLVGANTATKGLYNVDLRLPRTEPAKLIYKSDRTATFGITELTPDVFAFTTGDFDFPPETLKSYPGTWSVYIADLTKYNSRTGKGAQVKKAAHVPEAAVLNGLTTLNAKEGLVLSSDSLKGVIWKINTKTGAAEVFLDDPAFKPVQNGADLLLGINGLKSRNDYVYFTNTFRGLYGRVKVSKKGELAGLVEIVAWDITSDDLDVDAHGNAYIATNLGNSVVKVTPDGEKIVLAGSQSATEVYGSTSVTISKVKPESLFISTSGGAASSINGYIEGGRILEYVL